MAYRIVNNYGQPDVYGDEHRRWRHYDHGHKDVLWEDGSQGREQLGPFGFGLDAAIGKAEARFRYKQKHNPSWVRSGGAIAVIHDETHDVYWSSDDDFESGNTSAVSAAGKDTVANQPLNVTRTKLIKALEDAQKRIRDEAEAERADALKKFDERVALYRDNARTSVLKQALTEHTEDGEFTGVKHAAAVSDETVEKQLRVLKLSEDKTVEVTPADDFYRYL